MAGLCNLALGWSLPAGISIPLGPAFKTHFYTHTQTPISVHYSSYIKKNKYNEIINEPYSTYLHKAFSIYSFLLGKHCLHLSLCLSSDHLGTLSSACFFPPSLLERRARRRCHLPVFVSMARGGVTGNACWRTCRKLLEKVNCSSTSAVALHLLTWLIVLVSNPNEC